MQDLNVAKILVLGRTGVGKSSFINYLLNDSVADVGVGKPITKDMFTFYRYENENAMKLDIIDTKGIEVENSHEYVPELTQNIINNCKSEDYTKWYHTIFYCVSLNNNRFEEFEFKLINDLSENINQTIHIVLTHFKESESEKADYMENHIKNNLKLQKDNIKFFRVCSIDKKTRGGVIHSYGRDIIINDIFKIFLVDVARKVSKNYVYEAYDKYVELIKYMEQDFIKLIEDKVSIFKLSNLYDIDKEIRECFKSFIERYKSELIELKLKYDSSVKPIENLYNSYQEILKGTEYKKINLDIVFDGIYYYYDKFTDEKFNEDNFIKFLLDWNELYTKKNKNLGENIQVLVGCFKLVFINHEIKQVCNKLFNDIIDDFKKEVIEERVYDLLYDELFKHMEGSK